MNVGTDYDKARQVAEHSKIAIVKLCEDDTCCVGDDHIHFPCELNGNHDLCYVLVFEGPQSDICSYNLHSDENSRFSVTMAGYPKSSFDYAKLTTDSQCPRFCYLL